MMSCIALALTWTPKPQWPSMTAVAGDSLTISHLAPGTMGPALMRSMYVGMAMTPCESWPARLALTQPTATAVASSSEAPEARSSALPILVRRSAWTVGMGSPPVDGSRARGADGGQRFRTISEGVQRNFRGAAVHGAGCKGAAHCADVGASASLTGAMRLTPFCALRLPQFARSSRPNSRILR